MTIGIDISQIVYEGSGVATYVRRMVENLVSADKMNSYVLFGGSLRQQRVLKKFVHETQKVNSTVRAVIVPLSPLVLHLLWNRLHAVPIEWFIGDIDVFWSSDWAQPPALKAKLVTTVHDIIALKYPQETHSITQVEVSKKQVKANIVAVHKLRLAWVKKTCEKVFCDSIATKNDLIQYLGFEEKQLDVVYPGGGEDKK